MKKNAVLKKVCSGALAGVLALTVLPFAAFADAPHSQSVTISCADPEVEKVITATSSELNNDLSQAEGYVYRYMVDAKWYFVGATKYVNLNDAINAMFEDNGYDALDYWNEDYHLEITCTDGPYRYKPSYDQISGDGEFYGNSTATAGVADGATDVPTVLAFQYVQKVISDGKTAADMLNEMKTGGLNADIVNDARLCMGIKAGDINNNTLNMGNRLMYGITDIEIVAN